MALARTSARTSARPARRHTHRYAELPDAHARAHACPRFRFQPQTAPRAAECLRVFHVAHAERVGEVIDLVLPQVQQACDLPYGTQRDTWNATCLGTECTISATVAFDALHGNSVNIRQRVT